MAEKHSVAFVCLGNICRSPMAEAIFTHTVKESGRADEFHIDSFGTGAYHVGENPDRRSMAECKKNGVPVNHKAQKFQPKHFDQFDYILAMDEMNFEDLVSIAPSKEAEKKVHLFGEYRTDKTFGKIVLDPYYGGAEGFATNFNQLTHFSKVFLNQLK